MSEVMSRWVYRGPPPFLVLAPPRLHLPLPSQFSLQEAALCGKRALGGAGTSECVFLLSLSRCLNLGRLLGSPSHVPTRLTDGQLLRTTLVLSDSEAH